MSQENKRAKLGRIQDEIISIKRQLDEIDNAHHELFEHAEILEIKLSELKQREAKLIVKVKPV